jgi:hypothetical protein
MNNFQLHRNSFGRLVYTGTDGGVHEGVVPVHAFPISAPTEGIALVDADGHELVWIAHLPDLPADARILLEEELASREFIPEIQRIRQVSTFATPSVWVVETDRGHTSFVLKGEDDIRRLNPTTLLIADSNGIHFLIRDTQQLDKPSRRLLDRFL